MENQSLIVRQSSPLNAEPPPGALCRAELTPNELFFVRNHDAIPSVDLSSYRLSVAGAVQKPLELTLEELRQEFATVSFPVTLQCAGNRRQELMALRPLPGELAWSAQAIGTALWSGVRLQDVLMAAGIEGTGASTGHAEFQGHDLSTPEKPPRLYQVSIPLQKAMNPEVLLAYEMNGQPLSAAHGFPLRVVVPGYVGARSVKWVKSIMVRDTPSDGHYQQRAYRLFAPHVRTESVDWEEGVTLGEMNVNAAICHPPEGSVLQAGLIEVKGYAIAGGSRLIARVDVSMDGGKNWVIADLLGEPRPWTWRLWRAGLHLDEGTHTISVRAVDTAADTQPESLESIWNFKGYMNNAWHRIHLDVRSK